MTGLNRLVRWLTDSPSSNNVEDRLERLKVIVPDDGSIDITEIEALCHDLARCGQLDRNTIKLLVQLCRRIETPSPEFDQFVFEAIQRQVLIDDSIGPDQTLWLSEQIFTGEIRPQELEFLRGLHTKARRVCPEFQQLLDQSILR